MIFMKEQIITSNNIMKQAIYTFTMCLFLFSQTAVMAQSNEKNKERWEKYKTEKIAFLTNNLELSPEEAQSFWPVYNQMDKERWSVQKCRRDLEHKLRETEETLSDKEATKLSKEFAGSLQNEAMVLVNFNEKFLEILPPQKVLKLYKVENEFRMYMIRKYRDHRKNGDKHP